MAIGRHSLYQGGNVYVLLEIPKKELRSKEVAHIRNAISATAALHGVAIKHYVVLWQNKYYSALSGIMLAMREEALGDRVRRRPSRNLPRHRKEIA